MFMIGSEQGLALVDYNKSFSSALGSSEFSIPSPIVQENNNRQGGRKPEI